MIKIKVLDAGAVVGDLDAPAVEFEDQGHHGDRNHVRTLVRIAVPAAYADIAREARATGRRVEVAYRLGGDGALLEWLRLL